MNIVRRIGIVMLVLGMTTAFIQAAEKEGKPDATLRLSKRSLAAGVGVSWGNGTLTYKGKDYAVSVNGLAVAKVGISKVSASGDVYNLTSLRNFDGQYTPVSRGGRGVTLGGGGSAVTFQNQNGVRIRLASTTRGADLTVGRGGLEMKVTK